MLKTALVLCLAAANCYAQNGRPPGGSAFSPLDHSVEGRSHRHGFIHPVSSADNDPLAQLKSNGRGDNIIPYYESWQAVENARKLLENHINIDEETYYDDPNLHYLAILGVIHFITQAIADTCPVNPEKYEREYVTLVQISLTDAWINPEDTADKIKHLMNVVDQQTSEVRNIIEALCGENNDSPVLCNMILTKLLKNSPDYRQQTKLLLRLGKIASLFEGVSPVIEEVAERQREVNFLLKKSTKNLLKPLVFAIVDTISDLHQNRCMNLPVHPFPNKPRVYRKHKHHKGLHSLKKVPITSAVQMLELEK